MDTVIRNKIYAGVLGKIIGVYLGRPVEGWSYKAIQDRFGEVDRYVASELGIPLIVADDDISGTFGFFRSVADHGFPEQLSSRMVGESWLNYIIEDKTILWWGGLGRSTEHTAYLRLKGGIQSPESGSMKLNGKTLSEQIGAQIFIDAFAMMYPNDPEKASRYVTETARVSHDGLAVEAAAFLGAMEADAFSVRDIDQLIDRNLRFVTSPYLLKVIDDVRSICSKHPGNWREARKDIDALYGYDKFSGPCHIIPNHAMVLASLLLGGDDFHRSITIASSAAWDTDCNAGNVGCLNGIRLGLEGINEKPFLREEVADRMLVVTADGGSCVTDAVSQSEIILQAIEGKKQDARFSFSFPGSSQGFTACPYVEGGLATISNEKGEGLDIAVSSTQCPVAISTPTFLDFNELAKNFSTIASPTLYEGQEITLKLVCAHEGLLVTPYILFYTREQQVESLNLQRLQLVKGYQQIVIEVPSLKGMPIFRFGLRIETIQKNDSLVVKSISWSNTPKRFAQEGMMLASIWETRPYWFQSWVGSAKQFAADFLHTYCISHPEKGGVVTIGTQDWTDYRLTTNLLFSLHESAGVVFRSKGLQIHYALKFEGASTLSLVYQNHGNCKLLKEVPFSYEQDRLYNVVVEANGPDLSVWIDGKLIMECSDGSLQCGGAGYIVDEGTMVARDFIIERC